MWYDNKGSLWKILQNSRIFKIFRKTGLETGMNRECQ